MNRYLLFLLAVVFAAACKESETTDDAALTADEFEQKIISTSGEIILDVRTPEEFATGHIEDAVLIDFRSQDFRKKISQLDKNAPILVYCASGGRSDKAASMLDDEGFKKVFVLKDGLADWNSRNKKIIK